MGQILKILRGKYRGKSMYMFSDDLYWGCQYYAHVAETKTHPYEILLANTSCVIYAGSFLEANLNELIASTATITDKGTRPSPRFWSAMDGMQKDLSLKQKWDLIASVDGGVAWRSDREPFQSYDVILTVRNELVHFKGRVVSREEIPIKKVKALLERFRAKRSSLSRALRANTWIHDLLVCRELGSWVAGVVRDFDINLKSYLTGRPLSKFERNMLEMRRALNVPLPKSDS